MKRKLIFILCGLLAVTLLASGARAVVAQSGGAYDLTWNRIGGGGAVYNTVGVYTLSGTIGQHEAGALLSGGGYALAGGFLGGGAVPGYNLSLPLILR